MCETVKKARQPCNIILANFKNVNSYIILLLTWNVFVRPILDYVSIVWSSHHIHLLDLIANVQRNFTKRLPRLYYTNYCGGFLFVT